MLGIDERNAFIISIFVLNANESFVLREGRFSLNSRKCLEDVSGNGLAFLHPKYFLFGMVNLSLFCPNKVIFTSHFLEGRRREACIVTSKNRSCESCHAFLFLSLFFCVFVLPPFYRLNLPLKRDIQPVVRRLDGFLSWFFPLPFPRSTVGCLKHK